jgi:predicted  nucleic acid-binding Zn-ribbon protein
MNVTDILRDMAHRATEIKQNQAAMVKRLREVNNLLFPADRLSNELADEEVNLSRAGDEWSFLQDIISELREEAEDAYYDLEAEQTELENKLADLEDYVGTANHELILAADYTVDSDYYS